MIVHNNEKFLADCEAAALTNGLFLESAKNDECYHFFVKPYLEDELDDTRPGDIFSFAESLLQMEWRQQRFFFECVVSILPKAFEKYKVPATTIQMFWMSTKQRVRKFLMTGVCAPYFEKILLDCLDLSNKQLSVRRDEEELEDGEIPEEDLSGFVSLYVSSDEEAEDDLFLEDGE